MCLPLLKKHKELAEGMDAALGRQGRENLITCLLAVPADFGADAAVFHASAAMLLALGATQAASHCAGLHKDTRQGTIKRHLPG
jgi:hypothetical protein